MVYDAARAVSVVFGGENGAGLDYAQTWQYASGSWAQLAVPGPSARAGVGMAYDSARAVTVLFGGLHFASPNVFYADTWELGAPCSANCDHSTTPPVLNVADFLCFQSNFASNNPAANCDGSTIPPILNIADFICFQSAFAQGCP
jgi:hypothetical protein